MVKDFQIEIEAFKGPLAVLLELIDGEELKIANVTLGSITERFLLYIEDVEKVAPHDVADFLIVAGRLLYLKSKLLLPELTIEDEEGIDLTDQLKIYARFAEAAKYMADRAASNKVAYNGARMKIEVPEFTEPVGLSVSMLKEAIENLVEKVRPYVALPSAMMERTVTIEEKIEELKGKIRDSANAYFHDITNRGSRSDVVASFLALLELLKQDLIKTKQKGHFEDIAISKV